MKSDLRIYRFSKNRFYGGVITAFCGECNINCLFCYSQNKRNTGKYLKPIKIGEKLVSMAQKHNMDLVRISGGDPFPKYSKLLKVIDYIINNSDKRMIIETNGVVLGQNPEIAQQLAKYPSGKIQVRVSIKHYKGEKFAKLTNSPEEWAADSVRSLENLRKAGVNHSVSWMEDWFTDEEAGEWKNFLYSHGYKYYDFDPEDYIKYKSIPYSKKEIKRIIEDA